MLHDQLDDEQQSRASFLRSFLFLDAMMSLCPVLTLRILHWADADLAAHMAKEYGYAATRQR